MVRFVVSAVLTLFWTLRTALCVLRRRHAYRDSIIASFNKGRIYPAMQCRSCRAVKLKQQGVHVFNAARSDPAVVQANPDLFRAIRWRSLWRPEIFQEG